ncbi:hypothetical protein A7D16_07475 [Xanthomonas nasturtii]|nr:hypothetical protein A7D16_07475 [Xanthomonas nasturtii]
MSFAYQRTDLAVAVAPSICALTISATSAYGKLAGSIGISRMRARRCPCHEAFSRPFGRLDDVGLRFCALRGRLGFLGCPSEVRSMFLFGRDLLHPRYELASGRKRLRNRRLLCDPVVQVQQFLGRHVL